MTNGTGECDVDEKRFWGPQAEPCKLRKLAGPWSLGGSAPYGQKIETV